MLKSYLRMYVHNIIQYPESKLNVYSNPYWEGILHVVHTSPVPTLMTVKTTSAGHHRPLHGLLLQQTLDDGQGSACMYSGVSL